MGCSKDVNNPMDWDFQITLSKLNLDLRRS
jgi:hypothetical protein